MEGYARVAQLMATHPEFAIFRKFQALNLQNLLYLQAEITHLEDELKVVVAEDARVPERQYHSRDWWSLKNGGKDESTEQWDTWLQLRAKLDQYNDTLLKAERIAKMISPRPYDVRFLRDWFSRPSFGSASILGLDMTTWDVEYEADLVGVKARTTPDLFSQWFTEKAVPTYHHIFGHKFKEPSHAELGTDMYYYEESFVEMLIRILTTVAASILPICSVVVLYEVQSANLKLGLVVLFSACFSLALTIMTNGRKIEVFAATAAFAAVNVVFLTNNFTVGS